jgi:hypothetical protein
MYPVAPSSHIQKVEKAAARIQAARLQDIREDRTSRRLLGSRGPVHQLAGAATASGGVLAL